uniref:Kunitz-type serine protease inhibitor homolog beta-bungarotoxin B5 chain n=1 Tax=Bungarus multicinctus TaxID=8616 RepID=VKTH5_BUNMU|nr:RecName: Full=Kunitz-type serine protease inhibitor homolog beta-bungarotoxin B5 chain; Flags: Precursor [Bungarus multicinctus]CAJ18320.1 beta-bungarotoxin b5 chain precursor [Bungarus multicinctus]
MSSGGLLLLLGLLTFCAELTPVSSRKRHPYCNLPPDPGPCHDNKFAFYHHPASNKCKEFVYGGCGGNDNRFKTRNKCQCTCSG